MEIDCERSYHRGYIYVSCEFESQIYRPKRKYLIEILGLIRSVVKHSRTS